MYFFYIKMNKNATDNNCYPSVAIEEIAESTDEIAKSTDER